MDLKGDLARCAGWMHVGMGASVIGSVVLLFSRLSSSEGSVVPALVAWACGCSATIYWAGLTLLRRVKDELSSQSEVG